MDVRKRDRGATEERVLDAAAELLARDGAAALGVNALAKEAGCDCNEADCSCCAKAKGQRCEGCSRFPQGESCT